MHADLNKSLRGVKNHSGLLECFRTQLLEITLATAAYKNLFEIYTKYGMAVQNILKSSECEIKK